ncbi:MAG TPA: hypothetical protein VG755_27845 [Nannocystaceae bacterium]|nr:hypothetical protein [Nannocystaceae bacterium]
MRHPTYLAFLGLVFGAGVVAAAPVKPAADKPHAKPDDLPQASVQLTPGCKLCLASDNCSPAKQTECKAQVESLLKTHYEASSAPELPVMRPAGNELPRDLKSGKYFKYDKSPQTFTSVVWPRGKLQAVPVDRLGKVSASDAAKAHRQPDWDANGQKIGTCDEYAYEEMYDVMRFLDAANACRGDRDCVMDVALMGATPGIADRELKRKDGKALSTFGPFPNQLVPFVGSIPKNEMFQLGDAYLYANGRPDRRPALPKVAGLAAWLEDGKSHYGMGQGAGNGTTSFSSEWKFHQAMREKTRDVSQAEREEYERRLSQFRELTAQHAAAVAAEMAAIAEATEPEENLFVLPYDEQTHDMFERYDRVNQIRTFVQRAKTQIQKVKPKAGAQQQHGARAPMSAIGMLGSLGPSPQASSDKPLPSKPGPRPKASKSNPRPRASECVLGTDDDWGPEHMGHGRLSCKIGEFLRNEWKRKLAGHKSCLDKDNLDCDWKPEMFSDRMLSKVPSLNKYKWFVTRCKAWTSGTFSPKAKNLDDAKKIIDDAEKYIGEARNILEPYYKETNSHGRVYGKTWGSEESYGAKKWFAANLDYEVGWRVGADESKDSNVCSLEGDLHGKVDADAEVAGIDIGLLYGDVYVESDSTSGSSGKSRYKGTLIFLGDELYKSDKNGDRWVSTAIAEEQNLPFGVQTPKATVTIPVGPVPVTGSLWGSLTSGYTLSAKGKAASNSGDTCDGLNKFSVTGGFTPFVAAWGNGEVGVGIGGIVSAGIRAAVTLVNVALPLQIGMTMQGSGNDMKLIFDSTLELTLSTLGGRLSLYIEFLLYDEEWELFRWSGIGPSTLHLMPALEVEMPIAGMKP